MSEQGDTHDDAPVTRAEFMQLGDELRQALGELRDARTPEERKEARADVADAQDAFESAAKSLGISAESLRKAAAAARKEERREELRPILSELLEEERERQRAEEEGAKAKGKPKPKSKPKAKGDDGDDAGDTGDDGDDGETPAGDSTPGSSHWGERKLSELLR